MNRFKKIVAAACFAGLSSSGFAGTVITDPLPANVAIVNLNAAQDGSGAYNGNQSLWYQPFFTGGATQLLTYTIQPGTYSFRVISPADAAQLFPALTADQTNQMFSSWTYNSPWVTDYLVFDGAAATNTSLAQLFDGSPDPSSYDNSLAAYNGAVAGGYYDQLRAGPAGRAGTVFTNTYTFATAETLIFAVPDNGLGDNHGGVSVLIAPATMFSNPVVKLWTGAADNNWTNAGNWSPAGVPATNDTISIFTTGTINLTSPVSVSGTLNWLGGMLAGSSLTIASGGVLNLTGSNGKYIANTLTNAGTVNWLGGTVYPRNDNSRWFGGIENAAGGLWNIQCDQQLYNDYGGPAYFHNAGTVRKTAGTGTTTISIPFNNAGTVSAQSGAINFNGGGLIESNFTAAAGTAIRFNGGTFTYGSSPVISGAGNVQFSGGALTLQENVATNLQLTGGTVTLGTAFQGGAITNLTISGSTFSGAATVRVGGTLNWNSGTLLTNLDIVAGAVVNWSGGEARNAMNVAGNGVLNLTGGNTKYMENVLTNAGTVNWLGGSFITANYNGGYAGAVENLASGLWNIQCDQSLWDNYGGGTPYFHNAGSIVKTNSTGTTTISIPFNNAGTVSAQSGAINFNGGGLIESNFTAATGAAIYFGGGAFSYNTVPVLAGNIRFTSGTLTLSDDQIPGLQMTGGTVSLSPSFQGGTITNLTLNGSLLYGTNVVSGIFNCANGVSGGLTVLAGATLNWSGGTISGGINITNGAVMNWSGGTAASTVNIQTNGVLNLTGGNTKYMENVLTNAGTVNWLGGSFITANYNGGYAGAVENLASGLWNIQCDQSLWDNYGGGTPYFHNAGSIVKINSTGTTTISIPFNNAGTVSAQSGAINFNGGGLMESNFAAGTGAAIYFGGGAFSYNTVPVLAGNIQFTGGTLTLSDDQIPGLQMTGGTVSLSPSFQGGTITNLNFGGSLTGDYTVSGNLTLGNGDAGTLTVLGGATLNWNNGNVSRLVLADGATLNWNGGTLLAGLDLTNGAVVNWSGGTAGSWMNVWPNGVLNLTSGNTKSVQNVLTNAGTVNWLGGSFITANYNGGYAGAVENLASGLWNIQCDQSLWDNYGGGTPYFHNAGTVVKANSTGTTTISIPFNNAGAVLAQSGAINFNGGGLIESNFTTVTGATIYFGGGAFSYNTVPVLTGNIQFTSGTLTLSDDQIPGLQMTGGTISLSPSFQGGTITNLTLNGSLLYGTNVVSGIFNCANGVSGGLTILAGATLNWSGGTIAGGINITNGAVANWSGGTAASMVNIQSNGVLNLTSGNTKSVQNVLTNAGTVNWLGGSFITANYNGGYAGAVENLASGLWNIQCDQSLWDNYGGGTPYFHNAGTVVKANSTGTTTISIPFNNDAGILDTETGVISFNQNNTYGQTVATLQFGLNGASHSGQMRVAGNINFNGTLAADLTGGYAPQAGDVISLITYNSYAGVFDGLNLPPLNSGLGWQVAYNAAALQIGVVSNANDTAQISGSVTDNSAHPLANLTVFAYTTNAAGGFYLNAVTDAGGHYALNVTNGTWFVGLQGLPAQGYNPVANQTVTINDANQTVNFVLQPYSGQLYTVTTAANPSAGGATTGGGVFAPGSPVSVTATADTSARPYYFTNWTENGVLQSSSNVYAFTVQRDRHLTANFALPAYTITVSNNPPVAGTVLGARSNFYGETNSLTAQPNAGYQFVNWTENGVVLGTETNLLTVIYTNHFIVANYAEANLSHVVTTATSPEGIATVSGAGVYTNGQTATFSAPASVALPPYLYAFQKFTLSNALVSANTSFSKTFATTDPTSLQYVAVYSRLDVSPQVTNVVANYPNPVPATMNLLLSFRFDRSMDTNVMPTVWLTNTAAATQPVVSGSGQWSSVKQPNDTYTTPPITLAAGMDGTEQVFIAAARDPNGGILAQTNALSLIVDATAPVLSDVAANPAVQSADVTWSSDEASTSQADFGLTASYGSSTSLNSQRVKAHLLTLTGLTPNTVYHYRVRSRDLAGNETVSGDNTFTTHTAPDLAVQNLAATGTFVAGGNIVIAWNDTNSGAGDTYTSWYDGVIVTNATTGQTLLNTTVYFDASTGNIPSGGSRARQVNFHLPDGAAGAGDLQIIVTANIYNNQFETATDNNRAMIQRTSTLPNYPDLQVVNFAFTGSPLLSGGVVGLNWQDTNSGNAAVTGSFSDRITVVNLDTTQTLVNASVAYDVNASGVINAGQAVNRQYSFTLPNGVSGVGNLQITVTADGANNIFEYNAGGTAEANNSSALNAVSALAAYPDLAVTNIVVPATATAGQVIQVAWTDLNLGNAAATNVWSDQIFLSDTAAVGGGQLLGTFQVTSNLAAGSSLTFTQSVALPQFAAGNQWIIVKANAGNSFYETNFANNSVVSTQAVNVGATLTLALSRTTVSESAGSSALIATLTRNGDTTAALTVNLSGGGSLLSLPASVTIPAGQHAANFSIGVVDQFLSGGSTVATLAAAADGFPTATAALTVLYDDAQALTLTLNANAVPEDAAPGVAVGTVTRNANLNQPLTVTLTSDLPSALTVPASVTIPAGAAGATFNLTPINDNVVGDDRRVHVVASATGVSPVSATIDVLNVNTVNLSLQLSPDTVAKGAASPASIGTISRQPVSATAQNVLLTVSGSSLATVPGVVTIPANAASVNFNINVGDDQLVTGSQKATLLAQALTPAGLVNTNGQTSAMLMILDTHGPSLAVAFADKIIAKGSNSIVTITRNTPPTNSLTVNLSASPADALALPATVTIPQNQTSVAVPVTAVLDNTQTGARNVALTASASGFNAGVGNLTVSDIYYADLSPTSLTFPTNGVTGKQITVSWVVANQGLADAKGTWFDYVYLASDNLGQQPTLVDFETNVMPLIVGASYTNQASFSLPDAPGNYWIVVTADGGNVVSELNKGNNSAITPLPVAVDASYRAALTSVSPAVAASGTPITFTGSTFNPQDHSPAPFSAATVRVLVNGTRRVYSVTSDANGNFSYTFQPLASEAGDYTAGADYPLVTADANQVSFALLGMQAYPGGLAAQLLPNTPLTGQFVLSNLTSHPLTGLAVTAPDVQGNLAAQFTLTNTALPGHDTMTVGYTLQSPLARTAQMKFSVTATSTEGAQLKIPAVVNVVPLAAQLAADPAYLSRGMLVGAQTLVSFDIVNTGGAATGDLTVQLPASLPWLALSSPATIPSIPAGGKATVILALNPPSDLPLTLYQGNLAVANNNCGVSVPFQFRAVSDGKGDLRVTVTDDYTYYVAGAPKVTNATVTVRDAITTATIAQTNSDASGIAYFAGLPEGNYTVDASAPNHNPSRNSAAVVTGTTNDLEAFMSRQLVSYQWTVVPTEIPDEYQIQLQSVFETEVPVPNVVIEEPKVMLFVFPGEASQFDLTLRNEGLIAAQGVTITPPDDPNYLITPLVSNVGTIPAQSAVTIPVTVQLRAAPATPDASGKAMPKDAGDCPVSFGPCDMFSANLNVQYYYPCGGNNVVQGRSAQLALLCEGKDLADKIKACLGKMKALVGSANLAAVGCNTISAFLSCVGGNLGPCQKAAISTACGALTGGVAGALAGGAGGLPACICAHLDALPLPSFPTSTGGGGGGGGDLLLPILPTGSYYVSGNPVVTFIEFGNCSDYGLSARAPNVVSRTISPISPLNIGAPILPKDASGGVCAHVRLQIDQDVVLTRTAFTGTLQIDNGGDHEISDIQVSLTFQDATNGNVAGKFVIQGPKLTTLSAVDGTGALNAGASGSAVYTFIPTLDAAPYAPETFQIGGTLSYTDNGEPVVVPLLSAPITVYPEARLNLAYFQQRDVYGDDPFTPAIEPSEPFALGLIVKNVGAGNAHNFRITSGQPKIVDNEKGLLINFNIIGTEVGDQPISPSLTASLGDIDPGGVKEVTWDMLSTLQGKFISYDATFQHVNDLGVTNMSLINSVEIHELIHRVLANRDGDDDLPDFLVNDLPDPGNLPDTLYLSDGSLASVAVFTNAAIDGVVAAGHMQVQLTTTVSDGWNYLQVPDPGAGFRLDHVVRSDGKIIALTNNVWTTDRSFPASSTAAVTENLLHLFDWAGSGSYTLYYRSTNTVPPAIVQLGPVTPFVQPGAVSSVNVTFSEPIDVSTFDFSALTLTRNGGANLITSGSSVTITPVADATYAINGLQTLTAADGNYQLTVNGSGIRDLWGNSAGNVSAAVQWTVGNAPVVVQTLAAISPNPRNMPVTGVNVTFSRAINPATFDAHALSLTLNGGPNLINSGVTLAPVSGNTYAISGLGTLTGAAGNYLLTVDASAIQDTGGTAGFGSQSVAWNMVTTGPRIVALEQLATNPRNIVVQSLNVTFAQPIDPATFDYHAVTLTLNGGSDLITSDVTVTPVNATTYKIANFNWVVGLPGTYTFTVNAAGITDLAGNSGAGSTNETWQMILETPPTPANLAITPDAGVSATDGLTDTNVIVLSGTLGATNLAVRVSDLTSGIDLGSATVAGTNFTQSLAFIAEGQHRLKLTAVDAAGNVSAPAYFNLFIDTTPPTAVIQAVSPAQIAWPVTNLLVTFSKAINTNTVSANNFTLTRDGANAVTPEIFILSSNAVLVTGLTTPTTPVGSYQLTLNLAGIQDLAGNSSTQQVSVSWQNFPANQPPVIVQEPNVKVQPGQAFLHRIQASDPENNTFTFSLAPGAPAGMAISTNGWLRWTPACDQGDTISTVTVWATDNGLPPARGAMTFNVAVDDCLQIDVGSTVVQTGKTGSVPVTVYSSAGVTNLSFTLAYPTNRFANWTLAASNGVVGATAVQTLNPSQTLFNVAAASGGSLQGSTLLGSISFNALPAPSAFVPLIITNAAGTKSGQSAVSSVIGGAGRVVVIGEQSLLEARMGDHANRQLILYGNPGASYQLDYSTNLADANWLLGWRVPMTNLSQNFDVSGAFSPVFYRAWEFSADPSILEMSLPTPTNASLLLYGQRGTNYSVEAATGLGAGAFWSPVTNLTLTNSFRFILVNPPTNHALFFRAKQ